MESDKMHIKAHWEDVYNTYGATSVSWFQRHLHTSWQLIEHTGVDVNGQIIDIGGGAATLADDLLAKNFHYLTVLDISGAALQHSKERLGALANQITWLEADITKVEMPPAYYDIWHDRAVFHFLTNPDDRKKYLEKLNLSLKPQGHLILATFALDGPPQCSQLDIVRYSPDSLQQEVGDRFELIESINETHTTPSAKEQKFTYCWFKKRS